MTSLFFRLIHFPSEGDEIEKQNNIIMRILLYYKKDTRSQGMKDVWRRAKDRTRNAVTVLLPKKDVKRCRQNRASFPRVT